MMGRTEMFSEFAGGEGVDGYIKNFFFFFQNRCPLPNEADSERP